MNIFFSGNRQLRNIWWVTIFFLVLASITVPFIFLSQKYNWKITIAQQASIVIVATWICQLMRRKPLTELTGKFNATFLKNFLRGLLVGGAIMLGPALFLYLSGWVTWQYSSFQFTSILVGTGFFFAVAIAEEFLFRGFIFQRLIVSIGSWGAQLIIAGYFLLIHINNPGMTGTIKLFASVNIFLASLMFGLSFIKTNSLAMPVGLHFLANWVQGILLGFGVSSNKEASILNPIFHNAPQWLTGGNFGLEASLPGLAAVALAIILLYRWQPANKRVFPA